MKTVLVFLFGGAVVGAIVASIVAPGLLTWYNTPGGSKPALCDCADLVNVASRLITMQLWGVAMGAGAGLALGIAVRTRKRPLNPTATPAAPAP